MNRLFLIILLIAALLVPQSVLAHEKTVAYSPNRSFKAVITGTYVDTGDPYTYDVVQVFEGSTSLGTLSMTNGKKGMARFVYDKKWSPDSRFFVFLTKEVNGHSFWHSRTTVFDTVKRRFMDLDDYIGAIVDSHLTFVAPDTLKIAILGPNGTEGDPILKVVSLTKLADETNSFK